MMKKHEQIPENDKTEEMKIAEAEEKLPFFATKRGRGVSALLMAAVMVVFMAMFMSGGGSIDIEANATTLGVACLDQPPVFIDYSDISRIELTESLTTGNAITSKMWNDGFCGTYENEEYGQYTLYAYSRTGEYIVVRHSGGVLVFNGKTAKRTEKIYQKLMERCGFAAE